MQILTCSPSGHVDPGEDDLTTALRETREEAGLGVEHLQVIDGFLQELRYEVRGRPKEVLYWLAELRDPGTTVTLSDEHQDYRWARLEEACTLARYKDLQDTLRAAHKHLEAQQEKQWWGNNLKKRETELACGTVRLRISRAHTVTVCLQPMSLLSFIM